MTNPLEPLDEVERLRVLARHDILDTAPEEAYDRITSLAARIFQVPAALVCLLDRDRIWFKSRYGLSLTEVPRNTGTLGAALLQTEPFIIEDASDSQALIFPANKGEPGTRFYACAPLITADGFNLGALCLIDTKPRTLNSEEIGNLRDLAALVMEQIKSRLNAIESKVKFENVKSSGENLGLVQKEFAVTLVHELRSPLNSILGFAQLLERENLSPSQLNKINQILQSGWHQAKLIDHFFELAVKKSEQEILLSESLPL